MIKNKVLLRWTMIVVILGVILFLCVALFTPVSTKNPSEPSEDAAATVFTSLDELESNILDSSESEFEPLTLSDAICYVSYTSDVPHIQFTLVESDDAGNYSVKNQSEKRAFSFDQVEGTTALYATYTLVPFSFIFSPTPIENTEAYNQIIFSNAYFYYKEGKE